MNPEKHFPELNIPSSLAEEQMPDLLKYWYLGTKGRRHMMLRRFSEVDAGISAFAGSVEPAARAESMSGLRVLDIGSAWGFNVMALGKMGFSVTGMDLVEDQFEMGQRIAGENSVSFNVVGADAARLPFAGGTFDAITMVETFEHIFFDDKPAALLECHRVLRSGGRIILSTPNFNSMVERFKRFAGRRAWLRSKLPTMCYPETDTDRGDYHPYNYHHPLPDPDIAAMLGGAGFADVTTAHFLFMLKNTSDRFYPLMSGLESLLEMLPLIRHLAATSLFIAEKR